MGRISTTNIDDLMPSEAVNVKTVFGIADYCGRPPGAACVFRNQEEQTHLHLTEGAPMYVSFHYGGGQGKGLAIDVFQQIKGHAYDMAFYSFFTPIMRRAGFTPMSDITGADFCHYQYDAHRKYTSAMIRSGMLPPPMPLFVDADTPLVKSIEKKLGLTAPGYWVTVLFGIVRANAVNLKALLAKTILKSGLIYSEDTLYATADKALNLSADEFWISVLAGTTQASADNVRDLLKRIDATLK